MTLSSSTGESSEKLPDEMAVNSPISFVSAKQQISQLQPLGE